MKHQWKQRLEALSAFGAQTQLAVPRVEFSSNRQVLIEGCSGILEYSETLVKLNCKTLVLELQGFELCLNDLSVSQVFVSGQLTQLRFLPV